MYYLTILEVKVQNGTRWAQVKVSAGSHLESLGESISLLFPL